MHIMLQQRWPQEATFKKLEIMCKERNKLLPTLEEQIENVASLTLKVKHFDGHNEDLQAHMNGLNDALICAMDNVD